MLLEILDQIGGSVLHPRNLNPSCVFVMSCNREKTYRLLSLFDKPLVNAKGSFGVRFRHFEEVLCNDKSANMELERYVVTHLARS